MAHMATEVELRRGRCADAHRSAPTHVPYRRHGAEPPRSYADVVLWRVHVELEDRPGRLGELATAVGRAGCNIISLHVVGEPADDGSVTDELLVRVPTAGDPAALVDEIQRAGIPCTLLVRADAGELADPATTALALARMVVGRSGQRPERGGHDAARPARRPRGRRHPRARPHAADRCGAACGWGGRGRSPRPSCRGPPRCWSWPPSSPCGCLPSRARTRRSCCCATARRCGCALAAPVGRPAGGGAARALLAGGAPRPRFLSPTPRLGPASWRRCSATAARRCSP